MQSVFLNQYVCTCMSLLMNGNQLQLHITLGLFESRFSVLPIHFNSKENEFSFKHQLKLFYLLKVTEKETQAVCNILFECELLAMTSLS